MRNVTREQIARRLSTCRKFEPEMCDGCARRLEEADRVLALIKGENDE